MRRNEPDSGPSYGAYGLRVVGITDSALLPVPFSWPPLTIQHEKGATDGFRLDVGQREAHLANPEDGTLDLYRDGMIAKYRSPAERPSADVVHPFLVPAAAISSAWLGREPLHAGAVVLDGSAVLLFGDRESGKSSTLAWLSLCRGLDVLADDLSVLDDGEVYAGPRGIDLRPASVAYLSASGFPVVRRGERHRVTLAHGALSAPVRAVVALEWSDSPGIELVPARQRLSLIAAQRMVAVLEASPSELLELATRPCYRLRRPRQLDSLPEVADLLGGIAG